MIHDFIGNSDSILSLNPLFEKAFDFIRNNDLTKMDLGKVVLVPNALFLTIMENDGKAKDAAKMEVHRNYIDIQYVLEGTETMGWATLEACTQPIGDFNTDKDIQFYSDKPTSYITVGPGEFVVFSPLDVHAPGIGVGVIKKVVVKVLV